MSPGHDLMSWENDRDKRLDSLEDDELHSVVEQLERLVEPNAD